MTEHIQDDVLTSLRTDDSIALTKLRERLAEEADRGGALDVAYRMIDTPVGRLLLAATPDCLVWVAHTREDHDAVLQSLADRISPRVCARPRRLDPVSQQLEEYFTGARTAFDVTLDLRLASGFRLEVLRHLIEIAYGSTGTYRQVANAAGSPRAVRAVGCACARNPRPVVVPCHRAIRTDGTLGEYVGSPEAKRALLELEGAA